MSFENQCKYSGVSKLKGVYIFIHIFSIRLDWINYTNPGLVWKEVWYKALGPRLLRAASNLPRHRLIFLREFSIVCGVLVENIVSGILRRISVVSECYQWGFGITAVIIFIALCNELPCKAMSMCLYLKHFSTKKRQIVLICTDNDAKGILSSYARVNAAKVLVTHGFKSSAAMVWI